MTRCVVVDLEKSKTSPPNLSRRPVFHPEMLHRPRAAAMDRGVAGAAGAAG